ncbi:hypothetical protein D3C80_1788200 [compost metagenome]
MEQEDRHRNAEAELGHYQTGNRIVDSQEVNHLQDRNHDGLERHHHCRYEQQQENPVEL